ncbi:MAG: Ig-like domain-containing protein [Chloroflexi bacterium]|nr:Ig-like domain-containing protein [Chloroflexota bacterium]
MARAAGAVAMPLAMGLILLSVAASGSVVPTNTWVDLYSAGSTYLGQPAPVGAYVAVLDPQGVQCGEFVVTHTGWYGIMPCYGDDPLTPLDEGAVFSDVLRFTINGVNARTEAVTLNGAAVPSTTVVTWSASRDRWQVDLHARLDVSQHTLASSANPADLAQPITFTTTISGAAPGGGRPTGTVQFRADGAALGGPAALADGQAMVSTGALTPGSHQISTEYSGDAVFNSSTVSLTQEIHPYERQCGLTTATYRFEASGPVQVAISATGALDCLAVQRVAGNHPQAPPGIATGQYWLITGTDGVGGPAGGFAVTLTLPAAFVPDTSDKVCHYTGTEQLWECAASSFDAAGRTVTRGDVTQLSTWAIGNNVGPTAVIVRQLSVRREPGWLARLLPALALASLIAAGRWRRRCPGGRHPDGH